ncbi:MAG TPA: glycosyltransferase family 2 protein [Candidatus Binatia bacterium]|nr:glycosyltransferase family 2 protein [Candidatus Binatia bacterium]
MRLVIQIPCYNEAATLAAALVGIPSTIPGVTCIETLVIDDGSVDDTVSVARRLGVDYIVQHGQNRGLARAFQTGLDYALRLGADVIVNTDGDNQYVAAEIPRLVAPVLSGEADVVIGDRQPQHNRHFSFIKRWLQKWGSWTVRNISGTDVPDAASGFRAYSREAALRLNVLSQYSYTLETIIQAGKLGLVVISIPVKTNAPTRPSRLQRNMWHFIKEQGGTILRIYAFYEPLRTFTYLAIPFLLAGAGLWLRFLAYYLFLRLQADRFIQSVTIGTGLLVVGVLIFVFGILADIAGKHRQLTQEVLYRLKKLEIEENTLLQGDNTEIKL